jgi:hypothetical protein
MVLWLRVAAAVAMLGALTFVVLNRDKNYEEPAKQLVKEEPKQQELKQPAVVEKQNKTEIRKQKAQPKTVVPKAVDERVEPQIAIVPEPEIVQEQPAIVPIVEIKKEKGITLTYSLPAIKKSEPVAEPVVADTKKTGLGRVLEIAKEVKNGDNPLGELREAKNDILALEFRKDKDKKKQ